MPSRTSPGPGPRRPPGCASPAGQPSRAGPRRAARPDRSAHCAARQFPRRWTPPPVAAPDAGRTRTEATPAATAGPARAEDGRPRATLRPPAGDRPGKRGRRRALHLIATDVEATIGGRGPARLRSSVLRIQFRWATAGTSAGVPASLLSVSPAGRTPRRWRTIPRGCAAARRGRSPYDGDMSGYHPAVEEYLETILELEESGILPMRARIVERLGVSAPAVSETVKRLEREGYLTLGSD